MDKLFDDTPYIDKNVITKGDRIKWKRRFQEYCNSPKIREESNRNGLNSCGCWYACDECKDIILAFPCSDALIRYLSNKGICIDFKNTSEEYFDYLLRLW